MAPGIEAMRTVTTGKDGHMIQAAIYARVSSESQADAQSIDSQVAALLDRVGADGLAISEALEFIDDGYTGATLIRPALERLRDCIAQGTIDRLYIHSPDRLARKYAYQVLLMEEFARAGVEVVFLNRSLGETPEDTLLLEVQGIVAEYERAKIMERSRRGKRHSAQRGDVSVLCGAPYGYHYVTKHEGSGQARYEVVWEEARVVRQIYEWVGRERVTIGEVCRRLEEGACKDSNAKVGLGPEHRLGDTQEPGLYGYCGIRQDAVRPDAAAPACSTRGESTATAGTLGLRCGPRGLDSGERARPDCPGPI
jgi:site-specific DNA recombinase